MNERILHTEVQQFINDNLNTDITSLLLRGTSFEGVYTKEIVQQIEAKNKCRKKLPIWFQTEGIYYPKKLSIEQTSSEVTASYKAELVSGRSLADITGGFGVDAFFFSKRVEHVLHCEIDEVLSDIAHHNSQVLGSDNIETIARDGVALLKHSERKYDWIYADPSRRSDTGGKVFLLGDCLPDVVAHQELLIERAGNILVKTAPLLDITQGLRSLRHVKEVHCVAVNNEMKELLWVLQKGVQQEPKIICANIHHKGKQQFVGYLSEEEVTRREYSAPKKYLYEPNAAILKAGLFKLVGRSFELKKIHQHSHLYTSDALIDFPGKVFQVEDCLPFSKKQVKNTFKGQKYSISTRNFNLKAEDLKKLVGSQEHALRQLFFTTGIDNKRIVIACQRLG